MKILLFTVRVLSSSIAIAIISTASLSAFAQSSGTLLVANQTDRTLSFIDPVTAHQTFALQQDRITGHEVTTTPAYAPLTCLSPVLYREA